jgi:hypothetical protein
LNVDPRATAIVKRHGRRRGGLSSRLESGRLVAAGLVGE